MRIKSWPFFLWMTAIIGTAFFVFNGSQGFFFSQDDFFFLYRVSHISTFRDFIEAFLAQDRFFYRPWSRVVLFFAQWKLFGLDAASFHLSNIAIHAFNGCLVFLLINKIFHKPFLAGISAVLYVSHPLSFLAVYWISGIQDLSMTAFILLSLWFYLKGKEATTGIKLLWGSLSLVTFALALLSKELALVTLILLPLVDWVHCRETNPSGPWRPKIGRITLYLVVLIFYLLINGKTLSAVLTSSGPYGISIALKPIVKNLTFYLGEIFYLKNATRILSFGITLISYFFLVVFVLFALKTKQGRFMGAFGIGWFIITISPILLVSQRTYSYYAYLPLAGIVILLAFPISTGLELIHRHYHRKKGTPLVSVKEGIGLVLLLFLLLGLSLVRVRAIEIEDPAGIISKSFLAQTALKEIKARYPEIPPGSELYLTGAGERERWALGHGDLFRLVYPGIKVSFVDEKGETLLKKTDSKIYWFQIPRLK